MGSLCRSPLVVVKLSQSVGPELTWFEVGRAAAILRVYRMQKEKLAIEVL